MANASRRTALLGMVVAAVAPALARASTSTAPAVAAAAAVAAMPRGVPAAGPRARAGPPLTLPASRCYGAAARVHLRGCRTWAHLLTVFPPPDEAQITPNSPCIGMHAIVNLCGFGVPAAEAQETIALVGDSHAWQWRSAVDLVAHRMRWSVLESTRSSCSLTAGIPSFPEPKQAECLQWKRSLIAWFGQHPEISTIFVSDHPLPVRRAPRQTELQAQVAQITAEWAALPATVRHIIVIRDIPYVHEDTLECVERAIARRRLAAAQCAVRRRTALHSDPDVLAAHKLRSPRVQVIDLTRLLCDSHLCFPVVGRVLAYRDADHLTRAFAETAGPYLYQALRVLMAGWS